MGKHARKTPYKKLLKEEKAKTKLKISHKTLLPKGQNVTDPSFRVRKIVVKSQLKERSGEVVTKSNLNVKVRSWPLHLPQFTGAANGIRGFQCTEKCVSSFQELIQRLQHHNAPLRINSLSSLCEIVEAHADTILNTYLSVLLHAASNLILDIEQEVRLEAIKLLSAILKKVRINATTYFVAVMRK